MPKLKKGEFDEKSFGKIYDNLVDLENKKDINTNDRYNIISSNFEKIKGEIIKIAEECGKINNEKGNEIKNIIEFLTSNKIFGDYRRGFDNLKTIFANLNTTDYKTVKSKLCNLINPTLKSIAKGMK